ncbi:hypothetical protein DL771_005812 [Monosporascus sp. 5C6A]|nr:hypothetical protein DL771_005812 [Monosporascus sp. 5C6A]
MELIILSWSPISIILAALFTYLIYFVSLILYRLCFSPLAKFPGSKLAAATGWYEFYYDYWLNGQYIFKIAEMHRKYGDIIGRICLDADDSGNRFLDDPDFAPEWYDVIHNIVRSIPLFTGFPWMVQILSYVPENVLLWAYPRGQVFNVFKRIVMSDMPESERSPERLAKEAQVLLGGGTASTARTIGFASYYILSRPGVRHRLETELRDVMAGWPQPVPTWAEFERLTFLQAIIKESLRLAMAEMSLILAVLYRPNGPKFELFETDESDHVKWKPENTTFKDEPQHPQPLTDQGPPTIPEP